MTACYLFLFLFVCICFAYEQSSIDSNQVEPSRNDDDYIDQLKTKRASYQHEQALLANIYSPDRVYISMHDGRVHPSNFTYFTFKHPGTYRFILITSRGDADLYISTKNKYVTYDDYESSSCTCGIDEIAIDSEMKRPIYIGVYGYSQYQPSHYRLLIELIGRTDPSSPTTETETTNSKHPIWDIIVGLLEIFEAVL